MSRFAAVVLAAGRATRFRAAGGTQATKLLATLDGVPLVRHAVTAALASNARPVLLVTGHAADAVAAAVADLPLTRIHNPDYADGLASSLRAGIDAVPPDCRGALVLLADMPGVSSQTLDALVARALDDPDADAVVPTHDGRHGNPVLLARSLFPAVARLTGDVGARSLLRDLAARVIELPLPDPGILADVDLPHQLPALAGQRGRHRP